MSECNHVFYVNTYFKSIKKKSAYLNQLFDSGHEDEALILCSAYIEALASSFYPYDSSGKCFCTALFEFSTDNVFCLVHTKQLMKRVKWFKKNRINAYNKSELVSIHNNMVSMSNGLYSANAIRSCLSEKQQSWFNKNWVKCSVAMITYEWIRCEGVHNIYPEPFHFGKDYPEINYQLLKQALDSLVSYLNKQCKQDKDLFAQFN